MFAAAEKLIQDMATAAGDNLELLNKYCNQHLSLKSHGIKHFEVIVLGHSLREGYYHDTTSCHGNAWRRGRLFLPLLHFALLLLKGSQIIGKVVFSILKIEQQFVLLVLHLLGEITARYVFLLWICLFSVKLPSTFSCVGVFPCSPEVVFSHGRQLSSQGLSGKVTAGWQCVGTLLCRALG